MTTVFLLLHLEKLRYLIMICKVKQVLWVLSWRRVILHSNKQVTITSSFNTVHYLCRCINSWSSWLYNFLHPPVIVPLNWNTLFSANIKHPASVFSSCGKGSRFTKNPELDRFVKINLLRITDIGAGLDIVKTRKGSCPCQDMNSHFLRCIAYSTVTVMTELFPAPLQTLVITFFLMLAFIYWN